MEYSITIMKLNDVSSIKLDAIKLIKDAKRLKLISKLSKQAGVGQAWLYKVSYDKCNPSLEKCLKVIECKNLLDLS